MNKSFLDQEVNSYHDSLTICKCQSCKSDVTNPREVTFFEARTKKFICKLTPIKKTLCHKCAKRISLAASINSIKYGIWGFPIGLLYSLFAILVNMISGIKNKKQNYRILYKNILYFASIKDIKKAYFVTQQAKKFATTDFQKLSLNNIENDIGNIEEKHINRWNYTHFILHISCYLIVILSFIVGIEAFKYGKIYFNKDNIEVKIENKIKNLHYGEYRVIDIPVDADGNNFYIVKNHVDLYNRPNDLSQITTRVYEMNFVHVTGLIPNHEWVRVITEDGYQGFIDKNYIEQYINSETINLIKNDEVKKIENEEETSKEELRTSLHPKFL